MLYTENFFFRCEVQLCVIQQAAVQMLRARFVSAVVCSCKQITTLTLDMSKFSDIIIYIYYLLLCHTNVNNNESHTTDNESYLYCFLFITYMNGISNLSVHNNITV